jgi:hypothetical protein
MRVASRRVRVAEDQVCGALYQDEVEGRVSFVDAQAHPGIAGHVPPLHVALAFGEYRRLTVEVDPDRGIVRPAVGAHLGEARRAGTPQQELSVRPRSSLA